MSLVTNVVRRGARYVFRCRIPADLLSRLRRKEYKRSLNTSEPAEARRRGAQVAAMVGWFLEDLRVSDPKDDADAWKRLADRGVELHDLWQKLYQAQLVTAAAESHLAEVERFRLELSSSVEIANVEAERRAADLARAQAETERRQVLVLSEAALQTRQQDKPQANPAKPAETTEPFSFFADLHVRERKEGKGLEKHSESQLRARLNLFQRIAGDRPITGYSREDILSYKTTLEKIPATYGKSPHDANRSIGEITARSGDRYSKTTAEKHMEAVAAVFATAAVHRHDYNINPHLFRRVYVGGTPPKKRKTWTDAQLVHLFGTPVWRGRQGRFGEFKNSWDEGRNIHRDCWFWLPLVAVYTGMRLEEIAKLRANEVREEGGIWIIEINWSAGRLKTKNSTRLVPVHNTLIELGFIAFAKQKQGAAFLFPELPPDSAGKRGQAYSRDFSRYRKHINLYEKLRDFHAFRHTFDSKLYDVTKDILLVAAISGHTPQELAALAMEKQLDPKVLKLQTVSYIHTFMLKAKAAMDKLEYDGLDLSYLYIQEAASPGLQGR